MGGGETLLYLFMLWKFVLIFGVCMKFQGKTMKRTEQKVNQFLPSSFVNALMSPSLFERNLWLVTILSVTILCIYIDFFFFFFKGRGGERKGERVTLTSREGPKSEYLFPNETVRVSRGSCHGHRLLDYPKKMPPKADLQSLALLLAASSVCTSTRILFPEVWIWQLFYAENLARNKVFAICWFFQARENEPAIIIRVDVS